jgi:hypothetical protein
MISLVKNPVLSCFLDHICVETFSQLAHTGPARMNRSHRWALSRLREVFTVHSMAPMSSVELKLFLKRLANRRNLFHE